VASDAARIDGTRGDEVGSTQRGTGYPFRLQQIPVARIRPEDGLDRKRDRDGHRELKRSIEQFGVLTPITVRPAPTTPVTTF
jgi:hypothetical protein